MYMIKIYYIYIFKLFSFVPDDRFAFEKMGPSGARVDSSHDNSKTRKFE